MSNEEATSSSSEQRRHSAFFYGTLMHTQFLLRVIQNNGEHLEVAPTVLHGYIKHSVRDVSFPGIIPLEISIRFFNTDSCQHNRVEGIAVRGLTDDDMSRIEYFEGSHYKKILVYAQPLTEFIPMSRAVGDDFIQHLQDWDFPISQPIPRPVRLETYVWNTPVNYLKPEIWTFKTFVKEKLRIWM